MILLNNLLIYIIFILLQLLVEVSSQKVFKPELHSGHTATVIDGKLYILGGSVLPSQTFFYLDVSVPFYTNELKWVDLTNYNIPPHQYAAAIKGGANNSTLFLYGGESLSEGIVMALVYTFDTRNNILKVPEITGIPPTKNVDVNAIGHNGLIYLFGGRSEALYTNDMFILDTINLSWKNVSSINAPSPRVEYGAVLLPNQIIVYMGGYNTNFGVFSLNEVYLYDTINDIWTTKMTQGSIPSARYSFSSVLGLDGQRIIIYGGSGPNGQLINPEDSIYVLDINNNFNWNIPKVSGKSPSNRSFSRSVLIGKYMVITFGSDYTQEFDSDILLLDISNNDEYNWTTSFDPSPGSNTPESSNKVGVIIGLIIGSVLGISLAVGSFFLYKWRKHSKEQNNAIPTPGDEKRDFSRVILQIPGENTTTHNQNQQAIPSSQIYNHRQEILPISGNTIQEQKSREENSQNNLRQTSQHNDQVNN